MSGLKKRIVWNQAMLFVYVVLILGLPYLWLSVDLAEGQVLPFLLIYALAAFLLLGLFVLLPLQYGRPLLSLERTIAADHELDVEETTAIVQLGARLPARLALILFLTGYSIFLLGILAMRLKAHFNLGQSLQSILAGIVICLVYSLFTLFTLEGIILPEMATAMGRLPQRVSLKGMRLSQKLWVTCGSLVLIAVLFVSSISFIESKKALERQAVEVQRVQLGLAISTQNWGDLAHRGKTEALVEAVENLDLGEATSIYFLTGEGSVLASNPHGLKPVLPVGLLAELEHTPSGTYVDVLQGKIYAFQKPEKANGFLLSEVDRSQFFVPLKHIVWITGLVCLVTLIIGFYLSYILANSFSRPLDKLGRYARQIS
ncbi:MAG: hypothetical protein PVH39_01955, partial [Syntrophobacterales bacterium]